MRATKCFVTASNSSRDTRGAYLVGLRGFFTIQSFLFFFLQVFAPRAVAHSRNAVQSTSTTLHNALEYVSIIFWNDGMIYSGFILLSARTICLPFMAYGSNCSSNSSLSIAGSVFRRGLRLWIPVAVALAISTRTFHAIGYHHVDEFAKKTINVSILAPYKIDDALIYFNSVFNIFWVTDKFSDQAGSYAFPGQMMWVVSVIYQQSFTVYMTMVIVPYTRKSWRVKAAIFFIFTAWWVQSWAWFTITGLSLADMVTNMDFKAKSQRGIKFYRSTHLPSYVPYLILLTAGVVMQYLRVVSRLEYQNDALAAHGGLYYTVGLYEDIDLKQPQAREDNYLVLLGFFLIVETTDIIQWILANPFLVFIGRRSFSYFLVQCIVIYTVSITLYASFHIVNEVASLTACFFATIAVTAGCAEVFYRAIEVPSHDLSHVAFDWIRE